MRNISNNSNLQVGDTFIVTGHGMNNTSAPGYKYEDDCENGVEYIVKALFNDGIYNANTLRCGTIETECGRFIWNENISLKLIKKGEKSTGFNYEIY